MIRLTIEVIHLPYIMVFELASATIHQTTACESMVPHVRKVYTTGEIPTTGIAMSLTYETIYHRVSMAPAKIRLKTRSQHCRDKCFEFFYF
jgi:hypothetical protein